MSRKGKKRLDVWLPENHPIFKVKPGDRTRVIQNLGDFDMALSLMEDVKRELLDVLHPMEQTLKRLEKTLASGSIRASGDTSAPGGQGVESYDVGSLYKDFGGLAVAKDKAGQGGAKR